ncbi:hypothetical protein [Amphritea japonica]|uniref:hypothetical protein n=1 Tax=Amphritea japonica TaxID=452627 RepID=UPI00036A9BAC|nr:hypothetical protein [Amphritea japonica]
MKAFIIIFLYIATISTSIASGNRDLYITSQTLKSFSEIELSTFTKKLSYLGSTEQWHVFGETLTSVSNGMPYSNTYGYKIQDSKLKLEHGWFLDLSEMDYWMYVPNCPSIYFDKSKIITQIFIPENEKNRCINYSEKHITK